MQLGYGKFILKQLDYSPSFSTSDSQLGCASLTICSKQTRAGSLIVNYYATLPLFDTKLAQKYAKRDHRTCAVTSRKKFHVSGCRRQAGDVYCLRCLFNSLKLNEQQKNEQPKRHEAKQTWKWLECKKHWYENVFWKSKQAMAFRRCRHLVSACCAKPASAVHASRDYHPRKNWVRLQNELREITFGITPLLGFTIDNILLET